MTDPLIVPSVSAFPHEHADWLELQTLKSEGRRSSVQDLVQEMRRYDPTDALEDLEEVDYRGDAGGVRSEYIGDDAFSEIELRLKACGGEDGNYPFELEMLSPETLAPILKLQEGMEGHPYIFLLLLARFGHRVGPKEIKGDKLFEEVCAKASESYFGVPGQFVESRVFGHPRRGKLSRRFKIALEQICRAMGEGVVAEDALRSHHQQDAKLDIIVWRNFPDLKEGKLIGFGNCTTRKDWWVKLPELQPDKWCAHWMSRSPTVEPMRLFFVPHIIEPDRWRGSCVDGGIFFDRCRITQHSSYLDPDLLSRCAEWSEYVRENRLC